MTTKADKTSRAYVVVSSAYITLSGDKKKASLEFIFKNAGRTPASDLRPRIRAMATAFPYSGPFDIGPIGGPGSQGILGPGETGTNSLDLEIDPRVHDGLKRGDVAIWLYGDVRYRDVFGDRHHFTFRLLAGGNSGVHTSGKMVFFSDGNEEQTEPANAASRPVPES